MAFRSAASSTTSMKARWRRRSGSGLHSETRGKGMMTRSVWLAFALLMAAGVSAWAAPAPLPRPVITAVMKKADCSLPLKDALEGINVSELDGKLKLVEVPCWRAAYQEGSITFVLDPAATAQ